MLVAQGAYSARHFGADAAEYRSVALASLLAAALVGTTLYLLQVPLSRGFLVLSSSWSGGPLLLARAVRAAQGRAPDAPARPAAAPRDRGRRAVGHR